MYSGFQYQSYPSLSLNASKNCSVLSEPIINKLQREVDVYTRKLEQEKRLIFNPIFFFLFRTRKLLDVYLEWMKPSPC